MKFFVLLLIVLLPLLSSCLLTKVVTVPMRVGGAVISVVPVVGNTVHDAIDEAAEVVDEVPTLSKPSGTGQRQLFFSNCRGLLR
ncbi:hypothetical protein VU04_02110 [Desulfobulbus sp. TB]|nr:hypothetical protein [Desulfobulbus sp. TB]